MIWKGIWGLQKGQMTIALKFIREKKNVNYTIPFRNHGVHVIPSLEKYVGEQPVRTIIHGISCGEL